MYALEFEKSVKKDFNTIGAGDRLYIKNSLYAFCENFSHAYEQELLKTGKIKKLQGFNEDIYRLKLRSYRVIYKKENDTLIILVLSVKSRENAYKK